MPLFLFQILISILLLSVVVVITSFPSSSTTQLVRFLPPPEAFGNLIQDLTSIVERFYPDSSPLVERSTRTWVFVASKSIYRCTGDFISGTLACAILVSFLISRHETPIYVFLIWAIVAFAYLMNNGSSLSRNDNDYM